MLKRLILCGSLAFGSVSASGKDASPLEDVPVIDQDGKERLFFQDLIASKKAIINFIYTRCERVCPPMGKKFKALQDKLGKRLGREVVLISITMDPEHDTPQDLKNWGAAMGSGPNWTLVTGPRNDLDRLSERVLGAALLEKSMHSPYIVVKGADGAWLPVFGLALTDDILEKLGPQGETAGE